MAAKTISCLLAALALWSCQAPPPNAMTAEDAVRVANDYRSRHWPRARTSGISIETADLGDRWRVTYFLTEGGTGGLSNVEVDKRSARIVRTESFQ